MQHEIWNNRIALRIDVDFACGLAKAVPYMLDILGEHGMQATFFVTVGKQTSSALRSKLIRKESWRRYRRLGLWRIITRMGPGSVGLTGDMLSPSQGVLQRILNEGHELGVHGFDHSWWAEHVWSANERDIENQMDGAYEAFKKVTPLDDLAWASPNWRTTDRVLEILQQRGVPYLSECWGREPFVTVTSTGNEIAIPHLPITLPCLESLRIVQKLRPREAVATVLRNLPPDQYNLLCMHGYYEGLLQPDIFPLFLAECRNQGLKTITLKETTRLIEAEGMELPRCHLTRGALPGFIGEVSRQELTTNES